ncbi:MAG: DegV family protein [Candidatus Phytoplasma pruni]|uniref:DegV family protein n=1 Tax=Milkweed yellows phytoplasma TaxID=208434 RepID=UPI00036FDAB8|nr:DegV family protein [Milkweed yellows phytoplasma]
MNKRKLGIVVESTIGGDFGRSLFPDLSVVHMTIIHDNKVFSDKDFDNQKLLKLLHQGIKVTTSQPNPQAFVKAYQEQIDLGYEKIFCLTLSKQFSGTYNSALKAKQILGDDRITVIDTESIGPGTYFTLSRIHHYLKENELTNEEIFKKVVVEQKKGSMFFSLDELKYLAANKKISKFKSFLGSLFKIKTILKMKQGFISLEKNVRTWKSCFRYLLKYALQLQEEEEGTVEVQIIYVENHVIVNELIKEIENLNNPNFKLSLYGQISPIVSIHLGSKGFGIYINKG